jgi:hypothetical protein
MGLEEEIGERGEHLDRKSALEMARRYQGTKSVPGAVRAALASTPASLKKYIDWGTDWPYVAALFVALLKDILDFVGVGSLPAIGTVVTIICSIFIFFMMLLVPGSQGKRKMAVAFLKSPIGRYVLLLLGSIVEMIFGIDFLPVETAVVLVAYWMLLSERKESESEGEMKEAA